MVRGSRSKGITPVIAIIMLLMLTLVVAGGAFAFVTTFMNDQQEALNKAQATSLDVKDLQCDGENIVIYLSNNGERAINAAATTLYVYRGDTLVDTVEKDLGGKDFTNVSGIDKASFALDKELRGGYTHTIELSFENEDYTVEDQCTPSGSPGGTTVGEAGMLTTTDGVWKTASFTGSYSNPVVIGTTNTKNSGATPLIPQVRNVDSDSAELRLCDHDNADACASHGTETMGYIVIDAAQATSTAGITAGTVTIPASSGENAETVAFDTAFSSRPVVFVTTQTVNGGPEFSTWVTSVSTTGFMVTRCNHDEDSVRNCEPHSTDETIGWVAIDPAALSLDGITAVRTDARIGGGGAWKTVTFPESFSGTPVGISMIQGNRGSQDPKTTAVRQVSGAQMDIHMCEHNTDDGCDGHMDNYLAWLAAEPGRIG